MYFQGRRQRGTKRMFSFRKTRKIVKGWGTAIGVAPIGSWGAWAPPPPVFFYESLDIFQKMTLSYYPPPPVFSFIRHWPPSLSLHATPMGTAHASARNKNRYYKKINACCYFIEYNYTIETHE